MPDSASKATFRGVQLRRRATSFPQISGSKPEVIDLDFAGVSDGIVVLSLIPVVRRGFVRVT